MLQGLVRRAVLHVPATANIQVVATGAWSVGTVELAGNRGVVVVSAMQFFGPVLPNEDIVS